MKKRYPSVYRVLVEERNIYMAKRLANIATHYPDANIIAVVGAGHEQEIAKLLKSYVKNAKKKTVKRRQI